MKNSLFAVSLLVSVSIGLVGSLVATNVQAADEPAWFKKLMKKEKKVRRSFDIEIPGGTFSARSPGKRVGKPEKVDEIWYFAADLGTKTPMECWIFQYPVNPAYATSVFAESQIEASVKANGPLQMRTVHSVDAGHVQGRPTLALEWLYMVGNKDKPKEAGKLGFAKVRSAIIEGTTLVCAHNQVGYKTTFAKTFEKLVGSIEVPEEVPHYYENLYVQSLDGTRLGFVQMSFIKDEDGDTRTTVSDASLIAIDAKTLSTSDTTSVSFSTPDGTLINAHSSSIENGELSMDLSLDANEGGWQVSGTFQGKELQHAIPTSEALLSDLGQSFAIVRLQASVSEKPMTMMTWAPEVDPTSLMEVGMQLNADRKSGEMSIAGIKMQVNLDSSGNMVNSSAKIGPATMLIERVWESGKLPVPAK